MAGVTCPQTPQMPGISWPMRSDRSRSDTPPPAVRDLVEELKSLDFEVGLRSAKLRTCRR